MGFSRKMLKAMNIEEDKIEQIIDAHSETVDALKADRDAYKEDAAKLAAVQKELDELKAKGDDGYKAKYEAEKAAHDKLKSEITAKETKKAKTDAYRELLKASGIDEKRIEVVLRASAPTIDGIELDADGKIKEADKYSADIKTEWGDFVVTQSTKGTNTTTPPANNGGTSTMTRADIMAIKDRSERQKAIAENPTLFGIN